MVRSNYKKKVKERKGERRTDRRNDRKRERERKKERRKESKTFYILQSTFCRQPSIALRPPSGDRL